MAFFVNDCSLHGQFAHVSDFRKALEQLWRCQRIIEQYQRRLFVSRQIGDRPVCSEQTFRETVQATGNRDLIRKVMVWIDRLGPFVEDERIGNPNEYLCLPDGTIVTDTALGAAAWHQFQDKEAGIVSIEPSDFVYTPIEIHWYCTDDDAMPIELSNFWEYLELQKHLQRLHQLPQTWRALIALLPSRYPHLTFLPNCGDRLLQEPFSRSVAERVLHLLDVLNNLKTCFDEQGKRTQDGETLLDNYFRRERALFSDASEQEKNDERMRNAMTFNAPDGSSIECFWHGKINTPPYRIHFTFPITASQPLYIAYIGPKLTKQ